MKPKPPTLIELEKEKNRLYVTKENPKRLTEILKKLNYIYYGIK